LRLLSSELFKGNGFREALNKGIDKEGKKSLKNDFINKMTFEFKSNGKFVGVLFGTLSRKMVLISKFKSTNFIR
jgi:hypothetical protein